MTVVGLGTQDSLQEAQDFVAEFGVESAQMLWDESFDSWLALGIRGQPNALLFDKDGIGLFLFPGYINTDAVLEEVRKL